VLDLLIHDADIVDGTGGPRRRGDVGVLDGRIVAIGDVNESSRRTIDVEGRVVAPGFIDVHTHFDAQVFWDPTLSPSPLHGVTTVIGGNCGFSIAPLRADAVDYIVSMLARVEGMPLVSLEQGVPWDWTSTADYLNRIDGTLAVNAGFLVGHSALRRVVMGEAASERAATADEVDTMSVLLREGLAAGGLGFSSSWGPSHRDARGDPVPSRFAEPQELIRLAAVCRSFEGTSLEFIPSQLLYSDRDRQLVVDMSRAAQRPLNWNVIKTSASTLSRDLANLDVSSYARSRSASVVALVAPIDFPARLSFRTAFLLDGLPGWSAPMSLPVEDRLEFLRTGEGRSQLLARTDEPSPSGEYLGSWGDKVIAETFSPDAKRYEGCIVADIARQEGKSPFDALVDIVCLDELRTTFTRLPPRDEPEDWQARELIWSDDRVVIGGSDAGAHLDFMASFNYPTHFLHTAVRDRGMFSIEEVIRLLTDAPSRLYGLRGRGRVAAGFHADLVVLEEDAIGSKDVVTRFDLPGGGGRLYADAVGISRVLVNGVEIVVDGVFTGARPGTVLRSGRDTGTPLHHSDRSVTVSKYRM
jgi:N-acyl-D-aspartate/D-glutamate deacylase